jgi:hypothetical protein
MAHRFTRVHAARLLSVPLTLLVLSPVRAAEHGLAPSNRSSELLLAQAQSEMPANILALEKQAGEL